MTDCDIVVVNYNAGAYLQRCLATVISASVGSTCEIHVVDNASADGSGQAAAAAHPQIHFLENPDNRGFGRAANQGIAAGDARYVFVLNPDSEIRAGTIADLVAAADAEPSVAAFGVLTTEPDGTVYPSARCIPTLRDAVGHALLGPFAPNNRFTRAYTLADWNRRTARDVDWVSGSCMLLRRTAIEQAGAFDPGYFMYAEDADLCTRLRAAGWRVRFTPVLTVMHERGVSTKGSRRMIYEHSRSIERYVRTWVLTGWKRVFLPLAKAILFARAAIVSRKATAP